MDSNPIVCFGEILWDFFSENKKIGGAPFNVATSLKGLGADVLFISRVGKDPLGFELLEEVRGHEISTEFIQIDSTHPTGKVHVSLDQSGNALFEIEKNSAWDYIEVQSGGLEKVVKASAFVFGSLITRGASLEALHSFLKVAPFKVFDLNLRPPHYSAKLLLELAELADMMKLNHDELYFLADLMESPYHSLDQHITFIAKETKTKTLCVTKGKFGAVLYHDGGWYYNSGFKINVKDTVGAGDSFLATLVYGILQKLPMQLALDRACAMGALVAGSEGANSKISEADLNRFLRKD